MVKIIPLQCDARANKVRPKAHGRIPAACIAASVFGFLFLFALTSEFRDVPAADQGNTRSSIQNAASSDKDKRNGEIVAAVHRLVNDFRQEQGLEPLTLDPRISAEAREHSAKWPEAAAGLAIAALTGACKTSERKFLIALRQRTSVNVGYDNPARAAVEGWKKSSEHRKNMLGDFSLTGIGIAQSQAGGYFFTQIFVQPQVAVRGMIAATAHSRREFRRLLPFFQFFNQRIRSLGHGGEQVRVASEHPFAVLLL